MGWFSNRKKKRKVLIGLATEMTDTELEKIFIHPGHPLIDGFNGLIDTESAELLNRAMHPEATREEKLEALAGVEAVMHVKQRMEDIQISASQEADSFEEAENEDDEESEVG